MRLVIFVVTQICGLCFCGGNVFQCRFQSYFLRYGVQNDGMGYSHIDSAEQVIEVGNSAVKKANKRVLPDICLDGLGISGRLHCGNSTYQFICHEHAVAYRVDYDDSATVFNVGRSLRKMLDLISPADQD
ncbi:MAG: hypothetical protein IPO40_17375 [Fibrobacteres bacterium]|nr:hypothetical protein [Fibrobacterota bacterium]